MTQLCEIVSVAALSLAPCDQVHHDTSPALLVAGVRGSVPTLVRPDTSLSANGTASPLIDTERVLATSVF